MRGRVDVSEGFPRPAAGILSTNLIQQFDYGLGLSRILQLKERSPAPTLGSELVPVIIVDDLKKSSHPPRSYVIGSRTLLCGGVNRGWVGVNCRGSASTSPAAVNERLVVHWIRVAVSAAMTMALEVGTTSGVVGLNGSYAMRCDSTRDVPAVGVMRTDFTGTLVGESAAQVPDTYAQQFYAVQNQETRLDGPWIIAQGEAVFVYQATPAAGTISATFFCEEYLAP